MTATPTARRAAPPRKTGSPVKKTAAAALAVAGLAVGFLALAAGCSAVLDAATGPAPALPPVVAPAVTDAPQAAPTSTCDAAREAILTGTPEDVTQAMRALVHDKQAPATAREYARYYLVRDAEDPVMQEMDVTLIQSACNS